MTEITKNTRAPSITCLWSSSDSTIVSPVGQTRSGSFKLLMTFLPFPYFAASNSLVNNVPSWLDLHRFRCNPADCSQGQFTLTRSTTRLRKPKLHQNMASVCQHRASSRWSAGQASIQLCQSRMTACHVKTNCRTAFPTPTLVRSACRDRTHPHPAGHHENTPTSQILLQDMHFRASRACQMSARQPKARIRRSCPSDT